MAKANRICRTCGNAYYFCPTCGTHEPSWKKLYDTEECMEAYNALASYNLGNLSADETNELIKDVVFADEELKPILDKVKSECSTKKIKKSDIVSEF